MGTVPILEMMKKVKASNDINACNSLKKQPIAERDTLLELESSLGFHATLKAGSQ